MVGDEVGEIDGGEVALADDDVAVDDGVGGGDGLAEEQCGYGVVEGSGEGDVVEVEDGEVGGLAGGDVADVVAAKDLCAATGGDLEGPADGESAGAVLDALEEHGLAGFGEEAGAVVGGGAVDTEADGDTGGEHGGERGDAGAEAHVGVGAVGYAGPGAAEELDAFGGRAERSGRARRRGRSSRRTRRSGRGVRPKRSRE